jgi:hypothetical protein
VLVKTIGVLIFTNICDSGELTMDNEKQEGHEDELSTIVGDAETINSIFNGPMELLKDLQHSYGSKNYATTLEKGREILGMMDEPSTQFVKAGMAFSISAALEWVLSLGGVGVDVSKAEALLSKARDHFAKEDYDKTSKTLADIEGMMRELEVLQVDVAQAKLTETEKLVSEVRDVGAVVHTAEIALQKAKTSFDTQNYPQVAQLTSEANEAAEKAMEQRIQTISDSILFTRSIIDESKEIGVNVKEPNKLYNEAKKAFDSEDYTKCSELTKKAEELSLKLQDEHIKKVMALKDKMEVMKKEAADRTIQAPPESAPASGDEDEDSCPFCSQKMRWIEKYERYWCNSCQKYAPKK